jgi:hypothetical protein
LAGTVQNFEHNEHLRERNALFDRLPRITAEMSTGCSGTRELQGKLEIQIAPFNPPTF